ncbi:MAG: DNA ligase-1 [Bradymonadia bacterium]|jgi:DNA ligase-1
MRTFAELYDALDQTNATTSKVAAIAQYFEDVAGGDAGPEGRLDAAYAVYFLSGERLKRTVKLGNLHQWARTVAGVEQWVYDACYTAVGDSAETVALLVDAAPGRRIEERWEPRLAEAVRWIRALKGQDDDVQRDAVLGRWACLGSRELYVFTKLMTGALRVGVSKRLVVRALSKWSGVETSVLFHRLMGGWQPTVEGFDGLFDEDQADADASRPYPYFLASPLTGAPSELGEAAEWRAEWKWDGIRGQLIRRAGETWVWSRGEELVTDRFPEIVALAKSLPDGTVLDGEILAARDGVPMPFGELQRRINRKRVGKKLLAEVPVTFMAYDLLEAGGRDMRQVAQRERSSALLALGAVQSGVIPVSESVPFDSWGDLAEARTGSRQRGVEGLMLKRESSVYGVGRPRGDWFKWKVDPLEIDAVMTYAQAGHGRRANLYTDYTFGVWQGEVLVTVAKAYSGLDNAEIRELDKWIRAHTLEKFGPVRSVEAAHVFTLHFENVGDSSRHKSGVAVRFPRISRWRRDKTPEEAGTLEELRALITKPA